MIIDGHADFRGLLMHHVTTHWPDAIISAYDPVAAGRLPDEFSGAGNDIILLGNDQGDVDSVETLARFTQTDGFPAVVYFGDEPADSIAARKCGADGFFSRDNIAHDALIVGISDILQASQTIASTDSLFVGDLRTGIHPLIKGYRFLEKLAVSEHSAVYLAEKESAGIKIVLKVLRQDPDLADGIGAFLRFPLLTSNF